MSTSDEIPIAELVAVEIPLTRTEEVPHLYRTLSKDKWFSLWRISSCAREMWIAPAGEIAALAPIPPANAQRYAGWDVYERLLTVKCGLASKNIGDTMISGDVEAGWQNLREYNSELYWRWMPFMSMLQEDSRKIREKFVGPYHTTPNPRDRDTLIEKATAACHYARIARENGTKIRVDSLQLPLDAFLVSMQKWIAEERKQSEAAKARIAMLIAKETGGSMSRGKS